MTDTQSCFTYLKENVPLWIRDLQAIEKTIEQRQNEISRVPVPVVQQVTKRTGSTESIRLNDGVENVDPVPAEITSNPQLDGMGPPQLSYQQQISVAKRKRKTASLLTSNMSNPIKYRTRSMIIVYYDSEVQKSFENLVRNIGTGRNMLRKSKMAAKMEAFAGGLEEDDDSDDPTSGKTEYTPRINIRTTRVRISSHPLATARTDAFDAADKELEKTQSLCERAAHQFLRDGDCRIETEQARERFGEVLRISEQEVLKARDKEEKAKVRAARHSVPFATPIPSAPATAKIDPNMAIEVDDENDGEEPLFVPPVFRRTTRARP